jgi:hypothetical protein
MQEVINAIPRFNPKNTSNQGSDIDLLEFIDNHLASPNFTKKRLVKPQELINDAYDSEEEENKLREAEEMFENGGF